MSNIKTLPPITDAIVKANLVRANSYLKMASFSRDEAVRKNLGLAARGQVLLALTRLVMYGNTDLTEEDMQAYLESEK